jgi:hypothetical protein
LAYIPVERILWTNSWEYVRKEGEPIHYATGISLLLDKEMALTLGANKDGYSAGLDFPLAFGKFQNLGKVSTAILMPYSISEEIRYCFSYSFQN